MFSDVWRFLKRCWWHLIILVPGCIGVTILHESAHALAVSAQGGEVKEFSFLPDGDHWGYVRYEVPEVEGFSGSLVALAPYYMWIGFAIIATLLALLPLRWRFWFASVIFFWLFLAPLGDIANAVFPWWLSGSDNDLLAGWGKAGPGVGWAVGLTLIAVFAWGYFLQRRLFREACLGLGAFAILYSVALVGIVAATI